MQGGMRVPGAGQAVGEIKSWNGDKDGPLRGLPWADSKPRKPRPTTEYVVKRLEQAGAALLSLNVGRAYPAGIRIAWPEYVKDAAEAYGWHGETIRPPAPTPVEIARMDEALGWIALIHPERYVLRRIVGARALTNPRTQQPIYSWAKIARMLGCDRRAVQRWHEQGIELIVKALGEA